MQSNVAMPVCTQTKLSEATEKIHDADFKILRISKAKQGLSISFNVQPAQFVDLIPTPTSNEDVVQRAANNFGTIAFDVSYGLGIDKADATKANTVINVPRDSPWHKDLETFTDLCKTKFIEACISQKDDFSDSPFKNYTKDDIRKLVAMTSFLLKDNDPRYPPKIQIHIKNEFKCGYEFTKISKKGTHIVVSKAPAYKWENMDQYLQRRNLLVAAEFTFRYAHIGLSGKSISHITMWGEATRIVSKPAYTLQEQTASNCIFEDEDVTDDEGAASAVKREREVSKEDEEDDESDDAAVEKEEEVDTKRVKKE